MAVMYKIVEGVAPRLPDHFNSHLRDMFIKYVNLFICLFFVVVVVVVCFCFKHNVLNWEDKARATSGV